MQNYSELVKHRACLAITYGALFFAIILFYAVFNLTRFASDPRELFLALLPSLAVYFLMLVCGIGILQSRHWLLPIISLLFLVIILKFIFTGIYLHSVIYEHDFFCGFEYIAYILIYGSIFLVSIILDSIVYFIIHDSYIKKRFL